MTLLCLEHSLQHTHLDIRSHHNCCAVSRAYSPCSKCPGSLLKYSSVAGAKHSVGEGGDFMTASHMYVFVPCILGCSQASQGQLLVLPDKFTQNHGKASKFLQGSVSSMCLCTFTFNYEVQNMCPLSNGNFIFPDFFPTLQ